jgi:hypothetical protein
MAPENALRFMAFDRTVMAWPRDVELGELGDHETYLHWYLGINAKKNAKG